MKNINSECIKQYLQVRFNKKIENIQIQELEVITFLPLSDIDTLFIDDLKLFQNLKGISLKNMVISDEKLKKISQYEQINTIVFEKCIFENDKNLELLKAVKEISFSNCYIEDYTFLNSFSDLENLIIQNPYNDIDIDLKLLCNMSNLKKLILEGCIISDLNIIENLVNLNYISMLWTELPENISEIFMKLPNLKELFIENKYISQQLKNKPNLIIKDNLNILVMEPPLQKTK